MTDGITWQPVHRFVRRLLGGRTTTIVCGTDEWAALPDDDPEKIVALLTAASRWALDAECTEIQDRRDALKAAAVDIEQARDWAAVARRIRDRDTALRTGAHIPRKAS